MNSSADLKVLIEEKFGRLPKRKPGLRASSQLQVSKTAPTGYSALDGAINMLNEMGEESESNLEGEEERCKQFKESTEADLTTARQQVLYFNGKASEARGRVIEAQGILMTTTENLQQTNEALVKLKQECQSDIEALEGQLAVVIADIKRWRQFW